MSRIKKAKYYYGKTQDDILREPNSSMRKFRELKADDLDKELYKLKYREKLFCPHYGCFAKVSFNERVNDLKYFSTWNKSPHKKGCPYEVDYKEKNERSEVYADNMLSGVEDDHIVNVIKRTQDMINSINEGIEIDEYPLPSSETETIGEAENVSYIATLDGRTSEKDKNDRIYKREASEVSERDAGKTRCVYGIIQSTYYNKSGGYAYINFKRKDAAVKVYFAEWFKGNDPGAYNSLESFLNIIKGAKKAGHEMAIIAVGKVTNPDSGFNVSVDRSIGISINGHTYYSILQTPSVLSRQLVKLDKLKSM